MNNEVNFYRCCQQFRVQLTQINQPEFLYQAAIYINTANTFARTFNLKEYNIPNVFVGDDSQNTRRHLINVLFLLENYMAQVYANNVFELDNSLKQSTIVIDDTWQTKSTSYISHIRDVIRSANLSAPLNDAIMNRLDELQRQIDVKQLPLEVFTNAFFTVTEAIGKGAKNLEPAAKLFEKLSGAFYGLRRSQTEQTPKQLPAPETLGLPDYTAAPGDTPV